VVGRLRKRTARFDHVEFDEPSPPVQVLVASASAVAFADPAARSVTVSRALSSTVFE